MINNFIPSQVVTLRNALSATHPELILNDAGSRSGPNQVPYGSFAYKSAVIPVQFYKTNLWHDLQPNDTLKVSATSSGEVAYFLKLADLITGLSLFSAEVNISNITLANNGAQVITGKAVGGSGTYTYAWTVEQSDTFVTLTNDATAAVTATAHATKDGTAVLTLTVTDTGTGDVATVSTVVMVA